MLTKNMQELLIAIAKGQKVELLVGEVWVKSFTLQEALAYAASEPVPVWRHAEKLPTVIIDGIELPRPAATYNVAASYSIAIVGGGLQTTLYFKSMGDSTAFVETLTNSATMGAS